MCYKTSTNICTNKKQWLFLLKLKLIQQMNYWLAPNGRVWAELQIGLHYERALKIIDELFDNVLDGNGILPYTVDAVEFLENKGFIRYMDWSDKPRWIIYNQKPTRQQINKMFVLTKSTYCA